MNTKKNIKYYKPTSMTIEILIAKYYSNYIDELIPHLINEINYFRNSKNEQELTKGYIDNLIQHINTNKPKLITNKILKKIYKE